MTVRIGCFDVETTGLEVEKDRIVQAAFVMAELETGKEILAWMKLVNPGVHIPPDAVEIHGITDADVMKAESFAVVGPPLVKAISLCDILVGHNIRRYDLPLLQHEMARHKIPTVRVPPVFDTLEDRGATDNGKAPNLGELCWAYDVPYDADAAHDALYDVRVNLKAFLRAWQLGHVHVPELAVKAAA